MTQVIETLFRQSPFFRGKQRVASLLFKHKYSAAKDVWVTGKYGCSYLLPNLVESISKEIFVNGIYEKKTSDFIIKQLPQNGVFLDIGANIGAITVPVYKRRNDLRVVCVEASSYVFEYLKQNLAANNFGSIQAVDKALFYSDDEEMNFYAPESRFGQGSFSAAFTDVATKVKTIRLDSLLQQLQLPRVDFIKIDIEGYEYYGFKGATKLLSSKDAPDILFEFSEWAENEANGIMAGAAQEILRDMGYRIFDFESKKEVSGVLKKGFFMLFATKNKETLKY